MTRSAKLIQLTGGYYIRQGCEHVITRFEEWPFEAFGDPSSPECISLTRWLPYEKAQLGLRESKLNALASLTRDSLRSYLGAAANARKLSAFVNALSLIATYYPEDTPIIPASGIIQTYSVNTSENGRTDLLSLFQKEQGKTWSFGSELTHRIMKENGEAILVVEIKQKTDESQPIFLNFVLKPRTAYILEVDLRAFAPYDLLRFPEYKIPDSFPDSWNRSLEWTKHNVVFVTPDWPEGEKEIQIEIARVYDRGYIWFRTLNLIEVNAAEPFRGGENGSNALAY